MLKITFDVEYGIMTNKSLEEAINNICNQLHIERSQIKNMQFYNMDDMEGMDIMMRRRSKEDIKKQKNFPKTVD